MIQNGSSYQLHCYYCRNVISNKRTASPAQCYTRVFSKSQPQVYSLEYVYLCILIKKKSLYLQNFTDRKAVSFTLSQNRCTCGNCQVLERVEAYICYQEIEAVQNNNIEAVTSGEYEEQPQCITQDPGFHAVSTNRWVLQVAWYQYKQQYKAAYDGKEEKLFWHIAYRLTGHQLTCWCWGILGERNLSCASCLCGSVYLELLSSISTRGRLCIWGCSLCRWVTFCWPQLSTSNLISLENQKKVFFICTN